MLATSAGLLRLSFFFFMQWPLTVLMKQTRQAVCAKSKQSILLRCLWIMSATSACDYLPWPSWPLWAARQKRKDHRYLKK